MIAIGLGVVAATKLDATDGDHFAQRQYINTAWGIALRWGWWQVSIQAARTSTPRLHALASWVLLARLRFVLAQCVGALLGAVAVSIDYVLFRGGGSLSNVLQAPPLHAQYR